MNRVVLSDNALKDVRKLPGHIFRKFEFWVNQVSVEGIHEVRKIPGFHDEPLKGPRQGQRSIRLSRSYRAIYVVLANNNLELIEVKEINKHEY